MRGVRRRPTTRGIRRRLLPTRRQFLAGLLACTALVTGTVGWFWEVTDVPDDLNAFATQQNNVFYWSDGTEMARTGQVNRQEVPLARVPEPVRYAVLAAENETFYSDPGVSPTGIGRAVVRMATGGDTQGGSTITQQYVKNIYLNQHQDVSRKLSEIVIAMKLDRRMAKDDILAGYLNTSWFGRGSYGIERAAAAYYGKDVSALNPSEGAFLAALLKGAGLYDPTLGPENRTRAVQRWSWILDRMVATGHLTAAERAAYTVFPEPVVPPAVVGLGGQVGYLVDLARTYLESHSDVTPARFDLGGYQIRTTFDRARTAALGAAVKDAGPTLDPAGRAADRNVHLGAASVAADGRIVALYGGPDYLKQGFDDANTSNVPVGTAFTPLVYAAGLTQGVQRERGGRRTPVHSSTRYDGDDGAVLTTPEGPYWGRDGRIAKAVNDDGRSWGRVSLRTAVVQSVNGPMMQLGMDVGLEGVRATASALGLLPDSMGELVPAFPLGNSRPSAVRMASAYTAFADRGRHTDPWSVDRVTLGGAPVAVDRPQAAQVLDPAVAAEVDDALGAAVREGTGRDAAGAAPDAAGKTGTTADRTAGWFVGHSGGVATAVTVFRMDPKTLELSALDGLGGTDAVTPASAFPTRIWAAYTKAAR